VYLGLRDDKEPRDVVRERQTRFHGSSNRLSSRAAKPAAPAVEQASQSQSIEAQLQSLEEARRDGVLQLPGGETLAVTNLHKLFWPALKLTKGDLFRYYARVSPCILPVLADRPLVMKRFPNGVDAKPFYQHRAPEVPAGVRVEPVASDDARPQLVGGDLKTLLYTCQLAAISQDPWFSRVQSPGMADQVALDLDPPDDLPFARVLDVARWIRDELQTLGVVALPKTSGASGLHIYIPLAPGTPYESGLLFCQLVATLVAEKHPAQATVERAVRARGRRVYIDFLQNIEGKTLAAAYSARASAYAGVSTPLAWSELDDDLRREDFTIGTVPDRIRRVGDLWEGVRSARGANLHDLAGREAQPNRPRATPRPASRPTKTKKR
jgi:bifunctional non-homologous end joining protein LigD